MNSQIMALLVIGSIFGGCAKTRLVVFDVQTDPPGGYVDVNEITKCPETPCKVELLCKEKKGVRITPSYNVVAYPPKVEGEEPLFVQRKVVDPCNADGLAGILKFNFHIDKVKARERIEIKAAH